MKKVYLSVIGFAFLCRLNGHAQTLQDTTHKAPVSLYTPIEQTRDTTYNPRELHIDEINLVSSYYRQNGDHSPVTGGIGTEKVTDIANGIDLKLAWQVEELHKNALTFGLGYDHHTSASAALCKSVRRLKKQEGREFIHHWTGPGKHKNRKHIRFGRLLLRRVQLQIVGI